MSPPRLYPKQIVLAYHRAVCAEARFAALASASKSPDRGRKWRALERLELETGQRIRSIVVGLGGDPGEDPIQRRRGRRQGEVFAGWRWLQLMGELRRQAAADVARSEEIERLGPAEDAAVLARATAHACAIESFARLELAVRGDESIGPALALLERPRAETLAAAGG